jgi:hypothetical protein
MEVTVDVPRERLSRSYHRRWQATTGKYHALMRYRDTLSRDGAMTGEHVHAAKIFGSPRFLYREFLAHLSGYLRALITLDADRRFFHETRLWYYVSFFWTRWKMRATKVKAAAARPEPAGNPGR